MTTIRTLLSLTLALGLAACNGTGEPERDDGDTDRGTGKHTKTDGGNREILITVGLASSSEESESSCEEGECTAAIRVWVGDMACPPRDDLPPTYDTGGEVELPWTAEAATTLSAEVVEDGVVTVYALVVEPTGEPGCFCVSEGCVDVQLDEDSGNFTFPIERTDGLPDALWGRRERERSIDLWIDTR